MELPHPSSSSIELHTHTYLPMANFQYIALDAKGEQTTGVVQAGNDAEAIQQLRSQGLYPTQVVEEGKGSLAAGAKKRGAKGKKKVKHPLFS